MPLIVTTIRGPNLSHNLPAKILKTAFKIRFSEYAPAVADLVEPNSVNTGLRKTPKLYCAPNAIISIKKQEIKITRL